MNIITTVSTNNRVSMCLLMSISSWILLNIKLIRDVTTWHMKQAGEGAASRETECYKCVGVVSELSKYSLFVKSVTPPLLHQNPQENKSLQMDLYHSQTLHLFFKGDNKLLI